MDRLLKRALREHGAAPAGSCVDAEMLAAWSEGSLPAYERTAIEAHAADCERCLAMLATMARTAPPPTPGSSWWAQMLRVRWLVPMTAAAAALVLWIAVQRPQPLTDLGPASIAPAQPAAEAPASQESARSVGKDARVDRIEPVPDRESAEKSLAKILESPPQERVAIAEPATRAEAQEGAKAVPAPPPATLPGGVVAGIPTPASPPPAAAEPKPDAAPLRSSVPPPPGLSPAPQSAEAPAPATGLARTAPSARAPAPAAEARDEARSQIAEEARARIGAGAAGDRRAFADSSTRWRISGNAVERSIDAGLTWQVQTTGVASALLAGHSPSPPIFWSVGRSGTIVLTTDGGQTWRKLPFLLSIDLVSVTAVDASTATVATADGRTYRTANGGQTWTPPQENPPAPF